MRVCSSCGNNFKIRIRINGVIKKLRSRRRCLKCWPFGKKRQRVVFKEDLPR